MKLRKSRIITYTLTVFFVLVSCSMPFFHRAGYDYLTISAAAFLCLLLSALLFFQRRGEDSATMIRFAKADFALFLFGAYVLLGAILRRSVTTPLLFWKWIAAAAMYLSGRYLSGKPGQLIPVLAVPALVQAVIVILQRMGWVATLSFYFPVSGTFGNPSFPAVLIAVGLVAQLAVPVSEFKKAALWRKVLVAAMVLLSAAGLLCCDSRTAVLAVLTTSCLLFLHKHPQRKSVILVLSVLAVTAVGLYFLRPGSANVRLLIWRAAFGLFAEQPLFGSGAASFAGHYMYAQAAYFASHPDSPFVLLAGDHYQPYNELIRLLCEQGICGTLLFLVFAMQLLLQRSAARLPLVAIAVIGLTFNVSDLFVLYLVFWLLCGYASGESVVFRPVRVRMYAVAAVLPLAVAVLSFVRLADRAYMADPSHRADIPTYEDICEAGQQCEQDGKIHAAETLYTLAWNMIPSRITATFLLFELYVRTDPAKARDWGYFVLYEQPLRSVSGRTLQMKSVVRQKLGELESNSDEK